MKDISRGLLMRRPEDVLCDVEVLKGRFTELMENAREYHLSVIGGMTEDKAVEAVLQRFVNEEERDGYYRFLEEVSNIYGVLSPDQFLGPYVEEVVTLGRVHEILREAY